MSGTGITRIGAFKPWVKKVMPTVYDDTLTYYELLTKTIGYLNQVIDQANEIIDWVDQVHTEQSNDISENYKNFMSDVTKLRNQFNDVERWLRNEALPESVLENLNIWFDNGKLAEIINDDVFSMKANVDDVLNMDTRINEKIDQNHQQVSEQLADIATNVKSFGAKGDGVTDDTQAFLTAISSGNVIYFPSGTYKIVNAQINKDNIRIYGDGAKTTIFNNGVEDIFVWDNAKQYENVTIHDLVFKGNIASVNQSHIRFYGAKNVKIFNCDFQDSGFAGIRNSSGLALKDSEIYNCTFKNTVESAVNIRPFHNVKIYNNTFLEGITGINYPPHAIYMRNDGTESIGEGAQIYNNTFIAPSSHSALSNPYAIKFSTQINDGYYLKDINIHGNYIDWEAGINLESCENAIISNNVIYQREPGNTNALSCLNILSCKEIDIVKNTIKKFVTTIESYCIRITNTINPNGRLVFVDNEIFSDLQYCIRIYDVSDYIEFTRNKIRSVNERGAVTCRSIIVETGATVTELKITHNLFLTSTSALVSSGIHEILFIIQNSIIYDKGTDTDDRGSSAIVTNGTVTTKYQAYNYINSFYDATNTLNDIAENCTNVNA